MSIIISKAKQPPGSSERTELYSATEVITRRLLRWLRSLGEIILGATVGRCPRQVKPLGKI